MSTHSDYSPSSAHRYLNCAASIQLGRKCPKPPDSDAAREGTRAHECFERFNKVFGFARVRDQLITEGYPSEMVEYAERAFHEVEEIKKEHHEKLVETKVDISFFTRAGEKGTLDLALVEEFGRLIVIDFKYGKGHIVEPEENEQLIAYALGIAKKYDYNFTDVELMIIQPRGHHASGKTTRSWVCSMENLLAWIPIFKEGVKKCEGKNPKPNPGDWCFFCPGKIKCPAISDEAMAAAQMDFNDLPAVKEDFSLVGKDLGVLLEAAKRLEVFIGAVKGHAFNELNRGKKIKGWKLVPKKSKRRFSDPKQAGIEAHKYLGIEVYKQELKSPAKIEKLIKKHRTKEQQKKLLEWLARRVTNVSKGVTLVRESDPRPATTLAIEDFS
jgi:hypothetical protein